MKKLFNYFNCALCVVMLLASMSIISCDKEQPNNGEDIEQVGGENNGGSSGDNTGSGSEGNPDEELPDAITNSSAGVTLTLSLRNLTEVGVAFYIKAVLADSYSADAFGIFYSTNEQITDSSAINLPIVDIYGTDYSLSTSSLQPNTTYYYTSYIKQGSLYKYGAVKSFTTKSLVAPSGYTNLSSKETANCYIISKDGRYCFSTFQGNSKMVFISSISSVSVLWESFGTDVTPNVGDLVNTVSYSGGYITFQTADTFKEGNAVIAAKDANGNILWSWHIWLTDEPQGQEYYNNAGTMMDRNLGATSATPGDVGALGLLYQWGRKDPFLGSSSISSDVLAQSTITWPSAVSSTSSAGTIAYATKNPTTFIHWDNTNYDWYYTGSEETDNTRWTTSDRAKSIYDPCPPGWRVPDGGDNSVWAKALGSSSRFSYAYNSINEGINFSGKFGSASTIWYPASGYRGSDVGSLNYVGSSGRYWSASPSSHLAYYMFFNDDGNVYPSYSRGRALGQSVRCLQVID